MRGLKTRGGRCRGGFSGHTSSPRTGDTSTRHTINPIVLELNRSRLMTNFPETNYYSARILLELCQQNLTRAIDNIMYSKEVREKAHSIFNESRKLAFAKSSDKLNNQAAAQKQSEHSLIPSTSCGEPIVTQSETSQQQECMSEINQTAQFIENVSINEELLNSVKYITEQVESSPNDPSSSSEQLENEIFEFYENDTPTCAAQEIEEHMQPEINTVYKHAQSVSEQQSPQTVVQNQKVNQRGGQLKIGDTTYLMKKLPKEDLPSIVSNPEILEKLINQPMQRIKQ